MFISDKINWDVNNKLNCNNYLKLMLVVLLSEHEKHSKESATNEQNNWYLLVNFC